MALEGKRISILGDSISTYRGISNDKDANSTTIYNAYYYTEPFPLEKTYFMRVISELSLTLCVNNSYSGGLLSGEDDPDSGLNRSAHLSRTDGTVPDIIVVFMGINDLGVGVPLHSFSEDYERTLITIREKYPDASVFCINLPNRHVMLRGITEAFNAEIEKTVKRAGEGFFVADLFSSRLSNDFYYMNTLDGLHPDEDGMAIIAEVLRDAITANLE